MKYSLLILPLWTTNLSLFFDSVFYVAQCQISFAQQLGLWNSQKMKGLMMEVMIRSMQGHHTGMHLVITICFFNFMFLALLNYVLSVSQEWWCQQNKNDLVGFGFIQLCLERIEMVFFKVDGGGLQIIEYNYLRFIFQCLFVGYT
eukprot:TRINITY_DN13908_c1_g1_i1.p2 TRINITY_DN13908_c1_g1~~TRINITY_DN13908_c1_g1_i1.p2  ORF type:complete len:145 (+),score=7.20 TRINITY_DN13908_c1_g1_i1:799-1233(+)